MAMKKKTDFQVIPSNQFESKIFAIRGQQVMFAADLAELYGTTTTRLNEQVTRNCSRFPESFMFQVTPVEKAEVIAKCDNPYKFRFSPALPRAFTERGVLMLANVLKSERAVSVSIHIVDAFVRLKQVVITHVDLEKKIAEIEKRLAGHDEQFKIFQELVLPLLEVQISTKKKIGFDPTDK